MFILFQVHFFSYIHGRDDNKKCSERIHPEQVHVPEKSLELARFRRDNKRLRDHRHGNEQSGRIEDIPSSSSAQNHLHFTRSVEITKNYID